MAVQINTESCLKCGACFFACPKQAVEEQCGSDGEISYAVLVDVCDECRGAAGPRCRAECPVPDCIVFVPADGR
ncbi:MAG: 4Fe-4S binding protein [Deltaproteobacteria bacterium]|nr:4Fe-4S binding protein [Deltaproteobacteria bacterium]